MANTCNSTVCR